jgi:hypothetical protein
MGRHDPLGDGHALAGPSRLGREEEFEDPLTLLGAEPRAIIPHGDPQCRMAVELRRVATDLDRDGIRAGVQGALQDIAEDLPQTEGVRRTAQVQAVGLLPEPGLAPPPQGDQPSTSPLCSPSWISSSSGSSTTWSR